MSKYTALINNIQRSQLAYELYSKCPNYHHAMHIFRANEKVYDCLNNLLQLDTINSQMSKKVFNYLFHLEDWFLQFSIMEEQVENIEGKFSFDPLQNNIAYPSDFLESLT